MKKILLIAAMALITVAASAQQKFAHVNTSELIQLAPEFMEAQKQMMATQKEASDTYQSMVEEFNTKYSQYQQKSSTWTAAIKESKEKELTDIQTRIQEFQASIQQELAEQEQALIAPIQQKALDAVNKIAKDGGYIYVFEVAQLLYVDSTKSTDITPEAKKALGIPADRTMETLQAEMQALQQ